MADQVLLSNLTAQVTQPPIPAFTPPVPKQPTDVKAIEASENSGSTASNQTKQQTATLFNVSAPVFTQAAQTNLAYSFDKEAGTTVFRIVDSKTKQVLRQVPPEESLQMAKRIRKMLSDSNQTGSILDSEG